MYSRLLLHLTVLSLVTLSVTRGWGRGWSGGRGWGGGWGRGGYYGGRSWGGGRMFGGHRGFSPFGGFRSGYGVGSLSSGHSFRNSLIGGAMGAFGGMVAYDMTKRIFRPRDTPYHYGGRDYYWDEYRNPHDDYIICSISVDELKNMPQVNGHVRTVREADRSGSVVAVMENNDSDITEAVAKKPVLRGTRSATISPETALETLQYSNGSKPQMIVWACRRDKEVCCGTECCPVESGISRKTKKIVQIIAIVIVSLILLCCCFSLIYFLCRAGNEMGPMGFEPHSPYYGPDYVPGPPICPPYPDFSNPGFIPPYVQTGYPPPRPIYPDPQPPGDPIYTSGNYAPRERSSETVDLQRRSKERSENIQEKNEEKTDADSSSNKNRKAKNQKKEEKSSKVNL